MAKTSPPRCTSVPKMSSCSGVDFPYLERRLSCGFSRRQQMVALQRAWAGGRWSWAEGGITTCIPAMRALHGMFVLSSMMRMPFVPQCATVCAAVLPVNTCAAIASHVGTCRFRYHHAVTSCRTLYNISSQMAVSLYTFAAIASLCPPCPIKSGCQQVHENSCSECDNAAVVRVSSQCCYSVHVSWQYCT